MMQDVRRSCKEIRTIDGSKLFIFVTWGEQTFDIQLTDSRRFFEGRGEWSVLATTHRLMRAMQRRCGPSATPFVPPSKLDGSCKGSVV